jgi:thiol:disulfide interchange protein
MRRLLLTVLALLLTVTLVPTAQALPKVIETWYEGALGYELAVEEARSSQKPMFVYFRADWCGYCKQFEETLLSSDTVQSYFGEEVIAVTINPEVGNDEARLAMAYQVEGFPAIFMHSADQTRVHPIQRTAMSGGRTRLQRPEEFITTLRQAATALQGH